MNLTIPPVLADPFQSDAASDLFDKELAAARAQWAAAIGSKGFAALQFDTINPHGEIVSGGIIAQSTRSRDCFQLTWLGRGSVPLSHREYPKTDVAALLNDLPYSTEKSTVRARVKIYDEKYQPKEECILSLEGDTADKMVHEGLEITETAVKLAGLGAKNLAALLLALLRDNVKLKGKTSMNRLLRDGKQLATFTIKREDLKDFKQKAGSRFLFTSIGHVSGDKNLCDIIAPAENTPQINYIIETMGYAAPTKGDEKNANTRVQPGDKSNGRGFGWLQQAMERRSDPVKQFDGKTGGLESLGAETLAAMVLKVAGENREFREARPLARLFEDGKDIQIVKVDAVEFGAIRQQADLLHIPVHLYPAQENGMAHFVAKTEDAPVINRLCENLGLKPPLRTGPEDKAAPAPQKRGPGRPPKAAAEKTSVRDKVDGFKAQQGPGEKAAPDKAKTPKAKAPKPKAPTR